MLQSFDTAVADERQRHKTILGRWVVMLPRACIFQKSLIGQERTRKELFVKIKMLKIFFFFSIQHLVLFLPGTIRNTGIDIH